MCLPFAQCPHMISRAYSTVERTSTLVSADSYIIIKMFTRSVLCAVRSAGLMPAVLLYARKYEFTVEDSEK